MKKSFLHIIFALTSLLVSVNSSAAGETSKDIFHLEGPLSVAFDVALSKSYSPSNIALGDSISQVGVATGDMKAVVAGSYVKILGLMGTGQVEAVDSITRSAIDISMEYPELRKAVFLLYQIRVSILAQENDYARILTDSKELARLAREDGDPYSIVQSYIALGQAYTVRDSPRLALQYFQKAYDVAVENEFHASANATCMYLANCYDALMDAPKVAYYVDKAREYCQKINRITSTVQTEVISIGFMNGALRGQAFIDKVDELRSKGYLGMIDPNTECLVMARYWAFKRVKQKAFEYCDSIETNGTKYLLLENLYTMFGDWENAYESRLQAYFFHDSLQAVIQNEDFVAADAELNNVQLRVDAVRLEARNRLYVIISIVVLILLASGVVVAIFVARRRIIERQKVTLEKEVELKTSELRDKNTELEEQKEEIESQNEDLEEKNRVISQINRETTDSINYAQRIQGAILPDLQAFVGDGVRGAFSILMPYKIVSGDFYWARRHPSGKLIFVDSDCTGHGVPGAFMSMIGSTLLNEICSQPELPSAGDILESLDRQLKAVTSQSSTLAIQDGMDLAIVVLDPETKVITYSTARRPIYISHMGVVTEYKGLKRSIGDRDERSSQLPFTTTELPLSAGDTIYMCSDGFADQLGGQEQHGDCGKRLKNAGLISILTAACTMNINDQGEAIQEMLIRWKGTCTQVDDISMIGIMI